MSFNQSVLLPVTPDEAFALVTEPEVLFRGGPVSPEGALAVSENTQRNIDGYAAAKAARMREEQSP